MLQLYAEIPALSLSGCLFVQNLSAPFQHSKSYFLSFNGDPSICLPLNTSLMQPTKVREELILSTLKKCLLSDRAFRATKSADDPVILRGK